MQCNYNSFIQIINFHGLSRNALRCRKTGACPILVPLWYCKGPKGTGQYLGGTTIWHLKALQKSTWKCIRLSTLYVAGLLRHPAILE